LSPGGFGRLDLGRDAARELEVVAREAPLLRDEEDAVLRPPPEDGRDDAGARDALGEGCREGGVETRGVLLDEAAGRL
jgi:hypothetical protein